ncbi:hypothetical protein V6N13_091054 [Hibiscus sabdariffa]
MSLEGMLGRLGGFKVLMGYGFGLIIVRMVWTRWGCSNELFDSADGVHHARFSLGPWVHLLARFKYGTMGSSSVHMRGNQWILGLLGYGLLGFNVVG